MRTDWSLMVSGKDLSSVKSSRKKAFVNEKILAADLFSYIDDGWEKTKDYKNAKYVGVSKEKSVQQQFEDQIWTLFASMGFTEMCGLYGIDISYDFHDDELREHINILAVDDETALVILCFASDEKIEFSFQDSIKAFAEKMDGIRKEIVKQYPKKKVKFIWATHNYISNRKDLNLLNKEGITYFGESLYEYYSELSKHLGSCSRYQLLGNLFANQEIKNMENRIPAIQGKMGGYTYYSFSIEPEKLLKIGYVLHRSEANQNMMPTYQRLIKKKRLKEVRDFIDDGGYFPNSIIISIDTAGKGIQFDQSATKIDNTLSKIGVLHIPKRYRSAYIIDGQHRLYGYSDSQYASTNTIPVVAFVDLDRNEQIKLFMDINENQKAVPKSLRVTLNADMLWDSPDFAEQRQALRSKIAQMLGEEPTSPLHSRVVIAENESTPERCITVEALQTAFKRCGFFNSYGKKNVLQKEGSFDCGNNQETCDLFYPFIERCLLYIREKCLNEWNKGDTDYGILTINRGIQAYIRVVDDLINMCIQRGSINPKTQDSEDVFESIQYYLKPLADYINKITMDQRKDLRGYFGTGADTRFWRAFQKVIADVRPDFNPVGLDEYWHNEAKIYNDETESMLTEIESKVKSIISNRLEDYYGESWLIKALPKTVYMRAKNLAEEESYKQTVAQGEDVDIPVWQFIDFDDCKQIITNGSNWTMFFNDVFIRPGDEKLAGGKDNKTVWLKKLSSISNKLMTAGYSVPVDEYTFVKDTHDWLMDLLELD